MYLKLIIALVIGINCQVLAITQMRIAQINQFIADLNRNKIPLNVIQSRANNLKRGLSRRELESSYITNLDDAVQEALSKQIVPEIKPEEKEEVEKIEPRATKKPEEKIVEEEEEEGVPAIEEPTAKPIVKKTIPDDLAKKIESFGAEIAQNYDDQDFIASAEYKKSVETTYKTVQTQLLKHRKAEDFKQYQTILNDLADQFDAIKKRKKEVAPKIVPTAPGAKKEIEKPEIKVEPKPEDIPLYVEIDTLADKINKWFTDKSFIPTMKENTIAKNEYVQLRDQLIEFKKSSPPYYDMYYDKIYEILKEIIIIDNRKPLAPKKEIPTVAVPGAAKEVEIQPEPKKEEQQLLVEFEQLVTRSKKFAQKIKFPTENNLINTIAMNDDAIKRTIAHHAKTTSPIMHAKVSKLMSDFLNYKKQFGTQQEKDIYLLITNNRFFIDRLLQKRPLMFMEPRDRYLLRDGKKTGLGGFESIGTPEEKSPLTMANYLTYDEMQISALLGVSVPTYFINNGNRNNRGIKGAEGSYESQGVYVGLVGARFEKENLMEWAHIIITPEQNTSENGYGANPSTRNPLLDIWARFYGTTFPTFEEAQQDTSGNYVSINQKQYFNKEVYKKRMRMVIEPFLLDANERGKEVNKKVYAHIAGLGLGVWQKFNKQPQWLVDVYADILKNNALAHIQTLNFSYFPADVTSCGGVTNNGTFTAGGNNIKILFSKREPADPLKDENSLLVAQYAWDGNSYPGNEYWIGSLAASGDPAAASCSTIPELQNPEINLNVSGKFIEIYGK